MSEPIQVSIADDYDDDGDDDYYSTGLQNWDEPMTDTNLTWVAQVLAERKAQDEQWGDVTVNPHQPAEWSSILMKQVGQVAAALNAAHWYGPNAAEIRHEIIQAMAVCVAILDQEEAESV